MKLTTRCGPDAVAGLNEALLDWWTPVSWPLAGAADQTEYSLPYFIEDRASDVPYYNYYTAEGAEPKTRIYVEDGYARPRIREISEVSDVVRGLQRGYELHRVCFPAEVRNEVYALHHGREPKEGAAGGKQAFSTGD